MLFEGLKNILQFSKQGLCQNINTSLRSFSTTSNLQVEKFWRLPWVPATAAWPNYKKNLTHRRHKVNIYAHTWGVQTQTKLKCVDNSALGRQAEAMGRSPYVIKVYAFKHQKRAHGVHGKLGDRVLMAACGQKKKGIIVGLKQKQLHGIPRYDTNNVVFIEENGNPTGNRITAPLPNCIRPILQQDSDPKKADYTKLFSIATKWI